jgi:protein arginine N-methyltransferase 1
LQLEQDDGSDINGNDATKENFRCVDIILSEWMGYFLLRESMLDSLIHARDKFCKSRTGMMFPSHTTMYLAPCTDEDERKAGSQEYAGSMSDWHDFCRTTEQVYGVNMNVLEKDFEREQREYHLLSSRWTELQQEQLMSEPVMVKELDMMTCTMEDSMGIHRDAETSVFAFDVNGDGAPGPISGIAGWFTADFKSRTDAIGAVEAPKLLHPAFLSTGPENGYTHWGQQTFYFGNAIPVLKGQTTRLEGWMEMIRTKQNSRLYHVRLNYTSSRRRREVATGDDGEEKVLMDAVLMKSAPVEQLYLMP